MNSTVSSLLFLLLGSLALFAGLSAKRWQREETRLRVGTIIVGLRDIVLVASAPRRETGPKVSIAQELETCGHLMAWSRTFAEQSTQIS